MTLFAKVLSITISDCMKKYQTLILVLLLPILNGCATMDKREIATLNRVPFAPLQLTPEIEPTELRIDIVRQQNRQIASSGANPTADVPYHPLGFDLGNGLFYDLNGNLSFQILSLLDLDTNLLFKIRQEAIPHRRRRVRYHTWENQTLKITYDHRDRVNEMYTTSGTPDSLSYSGRWIRDFTIVKKDTLIQYLVNDKVREKLVRKEADLYQLDKWLPRREYQMKNNRIELARHFRLEITNGNQVIHVFRLALIGQRLVYSIEKSPDKVVIYSPGLVGKKIEIKGRELVVYRNNRPYNRYTVVQAGH